MTPNLFFTTPSLLARRLSMVDPLGFRGVATHFLHRVAPGFTGRVRSRTWFPILCWAAGVIAEKDAESAQSDEEPRVQVRARRSAMANLERALRLGAILEDRVEDRPIWRYGNRARWWELHRRADLHTTYRKPDKPPFFSSRSSEVANNALGCLRRSLERHALFVPSESRLGGGSIEVLPSQRYRLTDRGRELATAYESDLREQGVDVSGLKEWGLFPDRIGRRFKDVAERETALRKAAKALPVDDDGEFDAERFHRSAACMDRLFQAGRDPLFPPTVESGPVPATVRAFSALSDVHPVDAFGAIPPDEPWAKRLRDANAALGILMGRSTEHGPSLFEAIGRCFVEGMLEAFPGRVLDSPKFADRCSGYVPEGLRDVYGRRRSQYLRAWETLMQSEGAANAGWLPRVEELVGGAVGHFNAWVQDSPQLSLGRVVELHVNLPRFRSGRVLPLVDIDAGGAFLDAAFPWTWVEEPVAEYSDEEEDDEHDSDISDFAEAVAEDEDEEGDDTAADDDDADDGRKMITDYWRTAQVARRVLLGDRP